MGDEFARVVILRLTKGEAFWLAVIGAALAAIAAGYASGASSAHPPARVAARARVQPSVRAVLRDPSDAAVQDLFSDDDVVIEHPAIADQTKWGQPTLSIVVGLCGYSAGWDQRFIETGLPIALDLDPSAPQAALAARRALQAHDVVLLHLTDAPTQAQLARLRKRFGNFDGVASRAPDRFVQALDGTGLMFFDERGDADAASFGAVGIPFAQRDVTVDDQTATGYIRYMLTRTVQRSERQGRLVVLMRPQPHSLEALTALANARTVQFTPLTQRS